MSNEQTNTPPVDREELERLREQVRRLRQELDQVSGRLETLTPSPPPRSAGTVPPVLERPTPPVASPAEAPPVLSPPIIQPPVVVPSAPQPAVARAPKESLEMRLGTHWAPRIGMLFVLTGLAFWVTWQYHALSVPHRVALGYGCCAALLAVGLAQEKKVPQLARVLQAGGLALVYFVTYAAHYVASFRVIASPAWALTFLGVVVAGIIRVAERRRSAALAGMALFFGYYTSIVSGVDGFTLAANGVLAVAALYLLARHRWVQLSYGAVLATYLAYALWVWRLSHWGELGHLIGDTGYLSAADFQLRAACLSSYWLLFAVGAMLIRTDAMNDPERNGLVTLNNCLFFLLFSLLMHHAYPARLWQFLFGFGGALFILSALAHQRCKPDRSLMDTLFRQALVVATLGLISWLRGVELVAALAVESVLVLSLGRWMASRPLAWVARAVYAVAAVYAGSRYPDWDNRMICGVGFAAVMGYVCARLEKRARAADPSRPVAAWGAPEFYFSAVGTILAMNAAQQHFDIGALPWAWIGGVAIVAAIGLALRVRELAWAALLPLAWAHWSFYSSRGGLETASWTLAQSLALIGVTLGFGLGWWARARAFAAETRSTASRVLLPFAIAAMVGSVVTTLDRCPDQWLLAVFAAESLVWLGAGARMEETVFAWMAMAAMIAGASGYLTADAEVFLPRSAAWKNLIAALLLFVADERLARRAGAAVLYCESTQRRFRAWMVAIVAALALFGLHQLVRGSFLTVSWAGLGFLLLALGFAAQERPYRMAGLVALGLSLLRALAYDLGRIEVPYRILSFIGLGLILLALAFLYAKNRERLARWL